VHVNSVDLALALIPNPSPKPGRRELNSSFLPLAQYWERGLGGEGAQETCSLIPSAFIRIEFPVQNAAVHRPDR
jgi:hypothetical protein